MRHSPNVCAIFLGEETPVTANPENHRQAWPGAREAESSRTAWARAGHRWAAHSHSALFSPVLLPDASSWLQRKCSGPPQPSTRTLPHPPHPAPGMLQKACSHSCWVEGSGQDVWHSSHLKRTQCQSQTPRRKKKYVIELLVFQDPGNYCVIFTIVRLLISQGACLWDTRHQPGEPNALQTRWLRLTAGARYQASTFGLFLWLHSVLIGLVECTQPCAHSWTPRDKIPVPGSLLPDFCKNQMAENGFPLPISNDWGGGDEKGCSQFITLPGWDLCFGIYPTWRFNRDLSFPIICYSISSIPWGLWEFQLIRISA